MARKAPSHAATQDARTPSGPNTSAQAGEIHARPVDKSDPRLATPSNSYKVRWTDTAGRRRSDGRSRRRVPLPLPQRFQGQAEVGATLGPYRILGRLSSCAHFSSYLALDTRLGRRVELKLISEATGDERVRSRLIGQAKTLAKLSHPSIAPVLDVGFIDEQLFICLLHIKGCDIETWCREHQPDLRMRLTLLLQVLDALEEIHQLGLVHGALSSSNVRMDAAGQLHLVNFDLTYAGTGHSPRKTSDKSATPRVCQDQRLFVEISLRVLATDAPPNLIELLKSVRDLASEADVKVDLSTVRQAILSLQTRRVHGPRWIRPTAILGIVAALGLARAQGSNSADCQASVQRIAEVWNPQTSQSLQRTFSSTSLPFAKDSADRVVALMDRYFEAWQSAYVTRCTKAGHSERPEALDAQMHCLDRRFDHAAHLLSVLQTGGLNSVENAVPAALALPKPRTCLALTTWPKQRPPMDDDKTRRWRHDLKRVEMEHRLGRDTQARTLGHQLLERVEPEHDAQLWAELNLQLARIAKTEGDATSALRHLNRAAETAVATGLDRIAAEASIAALTTQPGRVSARRWQHLVQSAKAQAERAGPNRRLSSSLLEHLAENAYIRGQFREEETYLRQALAAWQEVEGPRSLGAARAHEALSHPLLRQNQPERAIAHRRTALAIRIERLGQHHPLVAASASSLAHRLRRLGRLQEAVEAGYNAAALAEELERRQLPAPRFARWLLAGTFEEVGLFRQGIELVEMDLSTSTQTYGYTYTMQLRRLSRLHMLRGDLAPAMETARRAFAALEATPREMPQVRILLEVLFSSIHARRNELDQALTRGRRAVAIAERIGDTRVYRRRAERNLATIYLLRGQARKALLHAKRGLGFAKTVAAEDNALLVPHRTLVAASLSQLGEFAEAQRLFLDCIRVYRGALGPYKTRLSELYAEVSRHYERTGQVHVALGYARMAADSARTGELLPQQVQVRASEVTRLEAVLGSQPHPSQVGPPAAP